jgi:hypothetical protein
LAKVAEPNQIGHSNVTMIYAQEVLREQMHAMHTNILKIKNSERTQNHGRDALLREKRRIRRTILGASAPLAPQLLPPGFHGKAGFSGKSIPCQRRRLSWNVFR